MLYYWILRYTCSIYIWFTVHETNDQTTVYKVHYPGYEAEYVDGCEGGVLYELWLFIVDVVKLSVHGLHQHGGGGKVQTAASQCEQNLLEIINI